jgi:hypothetical protein
MPLLKKTLFVAVLTAALLASAITIASAAPRPLGPGSPGSPGSPGRPGNPAGLGFLSGNA